MDRFDSAYSSQQRARGRTWLSALLLSALVAAGLLGIAGSVKAQVTATLTGTPNPLCAGSNVTLTTTLGGVFPPANYAVNGAAPYAAPIAGIAPNFVALDDDEVSAVLDGGAGNVFRFYGSDIDLNANGFRIGSNGFITFRTDAASALAVQIAPRDLGAPGAGETYNAIYAVNTDLSPQLAPVGDGIWWEVQNVGGGNALLVTWQNVPIYNHNNPNVPSGYYVNVQLVCYLNGHPNAGRVEIRADLIQDNQLAFAPPRAQQITIGALNNCQNPAPANGGFNQMSMMNIGADIDDVIYQYDPAAPNVAGVVTNYYQCPTGTCTTGGSLVGTQMGAGPYVEAVATPASTSDATIFYYTVTDMDNCTQVTSNAYQVDVSAQPIASAISPNPSNVCEGSSVQYSMTPTITGSQVTWASTAPATTILTSGAQNEIADITFNGGGTPTGAAFNVTATETGPAPTNCSFINTRTVTIYSVPVGPVAAALPQYCANGSAVFNAPATPGYTYSWSVTAGNALVTGTTGATTNMFTVNLNSTLVQPAAPVTLTAEVVLGTGPANLCTATFSASTTINPLPPAHASITTTQATPCQLTNVTYSVPATVGNSYSWTAAGGAFTYTGPTAGYVNGTMTPGLNSVQLQWTTAGSGRSITLVEQTADGCTRTTSLTGIVVNAKPVPSIIGTNAPCQFINGVSPQAGTSPTILNPAYESAPNPIEYTYAVSPITLVPGASSYAWTVTNGGQIVAVNGSPVAATSTTTGTSQTSITVRWPNTGAGTVSIVETNANGCISDPTVLNITVTPTPAPADFSITGPGISGTNICANALAVYAVNGAGTHTINVIGGTISAPTGSLSGTNPTTGTGAGGFSVTWGTSPGGTISHEYTVGGCASVETYSVIINPLPQFSITSSTPTICGNGSATFSVAALVNGGTPSYLWSETPATGDPLNLGTLPGVLTNSSITVNFGNPVTPTYSYSVRLVVTNTLTGCSNTVDQAFTLNRTPDPVMVAANVVNLCATGTHSWTLTGEAGATITISAVGGGTPSATTFVGAGPHAFSITWVNQMNPPGPATFPGTFTATQSMTAITPACPSTPTVTNVVVNARPAIPQLLAPMPPLCVNTTVPVNVDIQSFFLGDNYTYSSAPIPAGLTLSAPMDGPGGPSLTDRVQITNLGNAGPKSITTIVTNAAGCTNTNTYNFNVDPAPTPVITGPTAACNDTTNPLGKSRASLANFSNTYVYSTAQVVNNSYSWTVSNGYILEYSTNNGGTWLPSAGPTVAAGDVSLAATINANMIRVVFYGPTPGKVKTTEIHPGGCAFTTLDYNVTLNTIPTMYAVTALPTPICEGDATVVTITNSENGLNYRVEYSNDLGATWVAVAGVMPQAGFTGNALVFNIPATELTVPTPPAQTYTFRVTAEDNAAPACGWYNATLVNQNVVVQANPPVPVITITTTPICYNGMITANLATTVSWATYQFERRATNVLGWIPVGAAQAGGGALVFNDAGPWFPGSIGGDPLLNTDNFEYRVVATTVAAPNCVTDGTPVGVRVFEQIATPVVTGAPNPICWNQAGPITITIGGGGQDGVVYELINPNTGLPYIPAKTAEGNASLGVVPVTFTLTSLDVLLINPTMPTPVDFDVVATLRTTGGGVYARPVPASLCAETTTHNAVITVNPKPEMDFTAGSAAAACGSTIGTYTLTPYTPTSTYAWDFTVAPPAGTTPLTATSMTPGQVHPFVVTWGANELPCPPFTTPTIANTTLRAIETNMYGCQDTAELNIQIYPTVVPANTNIDGPTVACIYGNYETNLATYTLDRTNCPGLPVTGDMSEFPAGTTVLWTMPTGVVSGAIRTGQGTSQIVAEWYTTGGTNIANVTADITLPLAWGGCTVTITKTVTVYPLPTPVVSGPTTPCAGSTHNYTSNIQAGDTYTWTVVGGTIAGGTGTGVAGNPSTTTAVGMNTVTVTWLPTVTPGAYVRLGETSIHGCYNEHTLNIVVQPLPVPVISGPTSPCANDNVTFFTASNAGHNYNWTVTGGTLVTGQGTASINVLVGAVTGTFNVSVTETVAATTCSATANFAYTIVAKPTPTIGRVTPGGIVSGACLGQSIVYTNTTATGGNQNQWMVTGGNIVTGGTSQTVTIEWTTVGTQTLTLMEFVPTSQCTTIVTQSVNVVNSPAPAISGPTVVCGGTNTHTYSTPLVAGNTYAWSVTGGMAVTPANTDTYGVQFTNPGTGSTTATVTVTETNTGSGCATTTSLGVTIWRQPTPIAITRQTPAGPLNAACVNQLVTYSAGTADAGSTYVWTVTGGSIISSTTTTAQVQWTTLGAQVLTLVETTTGSTCTATSTLNVAVEFQPAPSISGANPVCGDAVATYSTASTPGSTYLWSVAPAGPMLSATTANSTTVTWPNPVAPTNYTLTVTETNATGNCAATTNLVVTVQPLPTQTTITGSAFGCVNTTLPYSVTNAAGQTYTWTVTGGTIVSGAGTNAINVEWTTVGNQVVTVVIANTAMPACAKTLTTNVAVEFQPAPSISGANPVCGNAVATYTTASNAGSTYLWSVAPVGPTLSATTANSTTVTWPNPVAPTNYTLTVTETNSTGNCAATTNLVVTVQPLPTQTMITGQAWACVNGTQAYSITNAAGQTYTWSVTGGTIVSGAGTNAINVEWTTVGAQVVTVAIANTAMPACTKTLTLNVAVEFQPNPVITGSTTVCTGDNASYSTPANAGSTYLWTVTGGTFTSGTTTNAVTIMWATAGTQTITVKETNATGNCFATVSQNVTVTAAPVLTPIARVSPSGNLNQACNGDMITYNVNTIAATNYVWTVTGGNILSGQGTPQVAIQWTAVGNQTLKVNANATGNTNCVDSETLLVTVEATPQPIITGTTLACINTIHTYSTPFVAGNTYLWTVTSSPNAPATPVFAPVSGWPNSNTVTLQWTQVSGNFLNPGQHTITVVETSPTGNCFAEVSMQVRVNPIPTPAITSTTGYGNPNTNRPGIVCNGSTHSYNVVAPMPGNTFFWTVTGGTINSGQNTSTISVTWGPAGPGTISVVESIPGSACTGTDTDNIDMRPTPSPSISGNQNPCSGSSATYTTAAVSGNIYEWSFTVAPPAGTFPLTQTGSSSSFTVNWGSVTWPNAASATIQVREYVGPVLTPQSCIATTTYNVTVRPNPPVQTISGTPNPVCATDISDNPQTMNQATYSVVPVVGGSVTYNWSVSSNGTIVGTPNSSTIIVQWRNATNAPTTGTVSLLLTSAYGCTSSSSYTATINPLPNPSIMGATSACQNSMQSYSTIGVPGNSYVWTVTGGNIIRTGQNTPNVTVEWTLPGSATLQVTETNTFGCSVVNTINVNVNPLPTAVITPSGATTFCQGGDVTLTAPLGFASYVWSTGETNRSIVVRTTGQYWLIVTDANGCSNSSDTVQINVFPNSLPIITTSGPLTFCEGGNITLSAPTGFGAYLWSTGETTQTISVTQSGTYTVTVADANGCTGTSTEVDVVVNPTPKPVLTVIGSTTICTDDTLEVRAPAGYSSYIWISKLGTIYPTTRSIQITSSDTVWVQVVDPNGCVGVSDTISIVSSGNISPIVTYNGPTTFCDGGAVTLTAPEGYATYLWTNGETTRSITVTQAGDYKVTVTDNSSCSAISDLTPVIVNPLPRRPEIVRTGDVLSVVSVEATMYQWYRNGTMIAGATQPTVTVSHPGAYRVEILDNKSCSAISEPFDVILTSVDETPVAGFKPELRVFPNPTSGAFSLETIISDAGAVRIELVNTVGETVMAINEQTAGGTFRASLSMGELAAGVYNVVVTSGNERWTVRLVRQ